MDWWQAGRVMGTVVLATTAVATFGWRVLREETDKLCQETGKLRQGSDTLRQESREAHDKIGERTPSSGLASAPKSTNSETDRRVCARGSGRSVVS